MPSRLLAGAWALAAGVAAQAAELADCRTVRPVDAAGRAVVGVEDLARDPARDRLILSAYDRRAVARALAADEPAPEGALYALPLERLHGGEAPVDRLTPLGLPPGGLRPHGIALAGDRLAVVNRTVDAGTIAPVVDRFALEDEAVRHAARQADPRLCRPNDVAWAGNGRLLVTNDRGACAGPAFWWERVANRPASFVLAFDARRDANRGEIVARGLRFANGIVVTGAAPVVAATRGRRLVYLAEDRRVTAGLDFAPDNLALGDAGAVWAAGPVELWRYAAFRAGWIDAPGASAVARWRPDGAPARYTVPAAMVRGATVAVPVGDRLLLGAAYDDHLLLCARP